MILIQLKWRVETVVPYLDIILFGIAPPPISVIARSVVVDGPRVDTRNVSGSGYPWEEPEPEPLDGSGSVLVLHNFFQKEP